MFWLIPAGQKRHTIQATWHAVQEEDGALTVEVCWEEGSRIQMMRGISTEGDDWSM